MGYDYWNGSIDLYTSYNYGWYFYKYLDKAHGIRFIYGKRGRDVLPFLIKMRETLQLSPTWTWNTCECFEQARERGDYNYKRDDSKDGWTTCLGNAYWFLDKIIQACIKYPYGKWNGD
jgi:hypothetical protein